MPNTHPPTLAERVIEYIDNLPVPAMSPALSDIWRMCDEAVNGASAPYAAETLAGLQSALGSALDNLPDVAGDTTFGANEVAACCADVAAMSHLLATDEGGTTNIAAYL